MSAAAPALAERPQPRAMGAPRILSLCCLYPNPLHPGQGLFVQRRLQHLAELAEVRLLAPFAVVRYGDAKKKIRLGGEQCPPHTREGNLQVLHPRWFYPPLSGSTTGLWLSAAILPVASALRREFPFDVIDTHFGHPEGIAGALLSSALKVPFTMTLRGNEPKHSCGRMERFWMSWALRRAGRVFTVSGRLRDFAIGLGASPERVHVIPNGVDSSVFHPHNRAASRDRHGFDPRRPLLLSAGALVERKGHHRIMQAIAAIPEERRPFLAIAGGSGPEGAFESELRGLAASLGLNDWVRFCGSVPETTLAELMSAADVFCLASSNEGWPNVVHEALACGAPVVATDVGAVPDMLAGRFIVVPPGDQPALQRGLTEALDRNWDRSAIAAWGQARGWPQVAAEVLDQMRVLVQEK
jgi:teichuronic acid biosynthesis glycosyltransferase TuaC